LLRAEIRAAQAHLIATALHCVLPVSFFLPTASSIRTRDFNWLRRPRNAQGGYRAAAARRVENVFQRGSRPDGASRAGLMGHFRGAG
jgi:hypothetical protein